MFLYMYQIFSSLRGHLHFFVHFFFTFMESFFVDTLYVYPSFSRFVVSLLFLSKSTSPFTTVVLTDGALSRPANETLFEWEDEAAEFQECDYTRVK